MDIEGFGTSNFDNPGQFKYPKNFRVKYNDGPTDNIYRIYPPMHSLSQRGEWRGKFWKVNYSYRGKNPRDETKTVVRPVMCIEKTEWVNGQPIVTQEDPQLLKNAEMDSIRKNNEARIRQQMTGQPEAVIRKAVNQENEMINKYLYDHRIDGS